MYRVVHYTNSLFRLPEHLPTSPSSRISRILKSPPNTYIYRTVRTYIVHIVFVHPIQPDQRFAPTPSHFTVLQAPPKYRRLIPSGCRRTADGFTPLIRAVQNGARGAEPGFKIPNKIPNTYHFSKPPRISISGELIVFSFCCGDACRGGGSRGPRPMRCDVRSVVLLLDARADVDAAFRTHPTEGVGGRSWVPLNRWHAGVGRPDICLWW